jgi:hypothetical protein
MPAYYRSTIARYLVTPVIPLLLNLHLNLISITSDGRSQLPINVNRPSLSMFTFPFAKLPATSVVAM